MISTMYDIVIQEVLAASRVTGARFERCSGSQPVIG
jgi:hypothetical protein